VREQATGVIVEKGASPMTSIVLCYAPGDEGFAHHLAGFLEFNLPVAVSRNDAIVGPDLHLIEATERALSADVALVLLSPFSVPRVWERRTWEPAFFLRPRELQTQLAFVLMSECRFPPLLRRQRFFDASADSLGAAREIKSWLLRPDRTAAPRGPASAAPELEQVRCAIADRPGSAADLPPEQALRFAGRCADDFEAVYCLDCLRCSRAGILGEIGSAAGLPMPGSAEQNRDLLSEWCATHRVLFVLAGVSAEDRDFVTPGGRASVIFTAAVPGPLPTAILSPAGDAVRKFGQRLEEEAEDALTLGWRAVNLLKEQTRLAEAMEVLGAMARAASGRRDMLSRVERELYWIRNDLDCAGPVPGLRPDLADGGQMSLPFAV